MQLQRCEHAVTVPVFHVNKEANKLIKNKIQRDNLVALPVGNLDCDVTVDIDKDCVVLQLVLPTPTSPFLQFEPSADDNENVILSENFSTVLAAHGTELHLIEVIDNDENTPNTFLATACVAHPGEALLPWNGYVWEVPNEIKEGKTVIAPIADCEENIQQSQARYAWNFLVHDFTRQ